MTNWHPRRRLGGSGRQGRSLAGASPAVSICSFRMRSDITVRGGNPMSIA
jgi:hypothetical protein